MSIGERLKAARERAGFPTAAAAAEAFGWPVSTYRSHENGHRGFPAKRAERYASAFRISPEWLLYGREGAEKVALRPPAQEDFVSIPRRDVRLSAGHGFANMEDAPILDRIPFTREFLRERLHRTHTRGLLMVKASGDSMEPTIGHDDLVMVDTEDVEVRSGIFAIVLHGEAMVKRLERTGAAVAIISDKPAYPVRHVENGDIDAFKVIGRVRWIGRVLG